MTKCLAGVQLHDSKQSPETPKRKRHHPGHAYDEHGCGPGSDLKIRIGGEDPSDRDAHRTGGFLLRQHRLYSLPYRQKRIVKQICSNPGHRHTLPASERIEFVKQICSNLQQFVRVMCRHRAILSV